MRNSALMILFCSISTIAFPQISINEIDVDQTGTDSGEFIELLSATPSVSLDGYVLVLFNGSDDKSYASYDLDGLTTDSNGMLLIANSGFPGQDLVLSSLQNGADAVAIYQDDASSFPNDTPVTTTNLIDALVYGTGDATDTNLLAGLGETVQYDEDINSLKDVESIQNAGDGTFCTGAPTPDASNIVCGGAATTVTDIATLKSSTIGETYIISGEVLLTFQQSFRNQKYVEDATAAILIDDTAGNITTAYSVGDGITNLTGQLITINGRLKFVPESDPGAPTSTGNTLTPQTVSLTQLSTTPADYDAELVKVLEATIDYTSGTWTIDTETAITTSDGMFNFRTSFHDADYIGGPIPMVPVDITGIVTRNSNGGTTSSYFLTARKATDIVESLNIQENLKSVFELYPNPTNGTVHIKMSNNVTTNLEIYSLSGKKVHSEKNIHGIRHLNELTSGIYLVKIGQKNQVATKKLIVK